MPHLEELARREGEAWAKGRYEQLRHSDGAIPDVWPGLIAFAYMVAEDLADTNVIQSNEVRRLAEWINEYAVKTWALIRRRSA